MVKRVQCRECGSEAFLAVVPRYVWDPPGRPKVTISDARIIRCGICGEVPADEAEKRRWKKLAWKAHSIGEDSDEEQCQYCGCPESETGQFHLLGLLWKENIERLCHNCFVERYGE